jgi:Flp pilus assembly protein TadG
MLAYPGTGASSRRYGRLIRNLVRNRDEAHSIIEFALMLPLLMMVVTGMFSVGIALSHLMELTNALREGGIAIQQAVTSTDPCNDATQAISSYAAALTPSKITYTVSITDSTQTPASTKTWGPTAGSLSCSGTTIPTKGTTTLTATYPANISIYKVPISSTLNMQAGPVTFQLQ